MSIELLRSIHNSEDNFKCFECGYKNSSWACTEFCIFLCIDCAHQIKSQCSDQVMIKSLQMAGWTEDEVHKLQNGGNHRLRCLMTQYNIPKTFTLAQKYSCQAAQYYKNLIKSEIYNFAPPRAPSFTEGLYPIGYEPKSWWDRTKESLNLFGFKDKRVVQGVLENIDGETLQRIKNTGVNAICGLRAYTCRTATSAISDYTESFSPEYVKMEEIPREYNR